MTYIGIDPKINIEPYISTRPLESYSKEALHEIQLLSFGKNKAVPFGSAIYRLQAYPGDLDLVEVYQDCCSVDNVVSKFEKSMKRIVKKIIDSRNHYYSEIKVGLDKRYDVNIGKIINGVYIPSINLLRLSSLYLKKKLLSVYEYNIINGILTNNTIFNANDYDAIFNIYREHRILRWTSGEILLGEKNLPNNKKILLFDALKMNSPVKIDEIVLLNGRYVEITNFLMLAVEDNGKLIPININLETEHDINIQLPQEIEKLYFSDYYYSPFKMIKRIYSLSRHNKDYDTLEKIIPFVSSNTSLLYQVKSEIDTISILFKKVKNISLKSIAKQLDNMKNRLASVIQLDNFFLINLQKKIDHVNNNKSRNIKLSLLDELSNSLKKAINFFTITYLEDIYYNPPPYKLLPKILKYKRITRYPSDNPENPLKKYDELYN